LKQAAEEVMVQEESIAADKMTRRKNLTGFWDKFKDRLVDLFKEEEDHHL
jgi:cell division protein FtsA